MIFIIIGIALIALGIILLFVRKSAQGKLFDIKSINTSKIKDLKSLCDEVAKDIGAGAFNEYTEVKGKIRCDEPLKGELSSKDCIYYSYTITREYEETYYETNDETGEREMKTRRGEETMSNNTRKVDFFVEDDTDKIKVDPDSADIDPEKVVDSFKSETNGSKINFGSFSLDVSGFTSSEGRRTLGYRFIEHIIPVDVDVYVLGEASDRGGELKIRKASKEERKFIISLKSEEELISSIEGKIKLLFFSSVASMIIGVAGIIFGILKKS